MYIWPTIVICVVFLAFCALGSYANYQYRKGREEHDKKERGNNDHVDNTTHSATHS